MANSKELKPFNLAEKTAKIQILTAQTAENIIEIGKTLLEVKENIPYGKFEKWLNTDINYSKRTAYNFMKVAKEFPNVQPVAHLGIRKLLALTGLESDDRKKIIADNDLVSMTTKEVEEIVEEEKMIKEVDEFIERLSHKLPIQEKKFDYAKYGFNAEDAKELEQIRNNLNQAFENDRIREYHGLLKLKEIFKDDKMFAKFVIQTELKEAIEEFIFEREFPDKLYMVWDNIEYNLKKGAIK